jgi:DNA primase
MSDLFEKVRTEINIADVLEHYGIRIDRSGKGLCPFHKDSTPSLSIDKSTNRFKCFACGESGSSIDFVAKLRSIEPLEAAKELAGIYGIRYEESEPKSKKQMIKEYLRECMANIGKTDYFQRRGLTAVTIKKYCLGYDVRHKSVVIPYSSKLEYYQSRGIEEKTFFKPKTEDAGVEPIFNTEVFSSKNRSPIFVVESPICALSIMQSGGVAVATCGTGGWRKVVEAAGKTKCAGGLILCFDNDEPGKDASRKMASELVERGIKHIEFNVAGDFKDPNELLMHNAKQLEANVKAAKLEIRKRYATDKDSFDAYDLVNETLAPITWIVENLLPTGLAILCAPSKYGKSWMVLQLCLAAAEGNSFLNFKTVECDSLYYALEDGKIRLQDRLKKMLRNKTAPRGVHFVIKADTLETGLLDKITEEIKTFPNIKLVIIDTLQKVRGKMSKDDTLYGNEYREMAAVKDFADKNKICVLFVHHLRKMADESDVFNMISGSTALMGAADTILIISKKKRNDENATFSVTGRDIQQSDLVIAFNQAEYKWEVEGTAEEIAARRERDEYENNVYVKTIKELVKRNPISGWSGSAQDLMKAVYDITGQMVADSATSVGKQISKFEYKLHCDDIEHKASRSSSRAHTFKRIDRSYPYYRQNTLYDRDDD